MSGVYVCRPATWWGRAIRPCPTCKQRRRMVVALQEWYGAMWTCCACGDTWSDGERHPRPFARGWRAEAAAAAKKRWSEAQSLRAASAAMVADLRREEAA